MQRQSLGSPAAKLGIHGIATGEEKRRSSASGVSPAVAVAAEVEAEEEEEIKAAKALRSNSRTERSIHLIPVLTLLCFLVLYLVSHDPSPTDLASVSGAVGIFDQKVVAGIGAAEGARGWVSAMRSYRGLKQTGRLRHRRLGNF